MIIFFSHCEISHIFNKLNNISQDIADGLIYLEKFGFVQEIAKFSIIKFSVGFCIDQGISYDKFKMQTTVSFLPPVQS